MQFQWPQKPTVIKNKVADREWYKKKQLNE